MEPERTSPTFWQQPAKGGSLPWSWAVERLVAARDYWLVTVRPDGRPIVRPVWGIWQDDRLLLSLGSTSHWGNLDANGQVTVSLGDAADVVIVEGTATVVSDDREVIGRFVGPYNEKYDWNFTVDDTAGGVVAIAPSKVLAWISGPADVNAQDAFPVASSRWRMGGP